MAAARLVLWLPLWIPAVTAALLLVLFCFKRLRPLAPLVTGLAFAGAFISAIALSTPPVQSVSFALASLDTFALFFMIIILGSGLTVTLLSHFSPGAFHNSDPGEFYLLLLLAVLGAEIICVAAHFAAFILGLELLSVSLYSLVAFGRDRKGVEAGLKYLVLAGAAGAFILFGMALIYAETGTLEFGRLSQMMSAGLKPRGLLTAGLIFMLVGIGFKLSWVPFHAWAADVYEGAPPPIAGFLAVVSKGAVLALLIRHFSDPTILQSRPFFILFSSLAVLTMLGGNLLALSQPDIKRLLAGSSIANFGYLLVAFMAYGPQASLAVPFYFVVYAIATLIAFGVVSLVALRIGSDTRHDHKYYLGLARTQPMLSACFAAALVSLAGFPLTAGFIGKFLLVNAGVESGRLFLVGVLLGASVIGLVYYLRLALSLFRNEPQAHKRVAVPLPPLLIIGLLTLLLLALGIVPAQAMAWMEEMVGSVL